MQARQSSGLLAGAACLAISSTRLYDVRGYLAAFCMVMIFAITMLQVSAAMSATIRQALPIMSDI